MFFLHTLQAIWPYSGHYHPTEENFREFVSFLEEHDVDLTNVKVIFLHSTITQIKVSFFLKKLTKCQYIHLASTSRDTVPSRSTEKDIIVHFETKLSRFCIFITKRTLTRKEYCPHVYSKLVHLT